MQTKLCGACGEEKSLFSFNRKGDGYQSKCRPCQREWYQRYYREDSREKTRLEAKRLEEIKARRDLIRKAKDRPCMDCGNGYPYYVMDFDHTDDNKEYTVGTMIGRRLSLAVIQAELDKCEIVCSNCHRERTHQRLQ
jgi:hypothetical protein